MNDHSGRSAGSMRSWPLAAIALILALPLTARAGSAPTGTEWKQVGPTSLRVPQSFRGGDGLGPNSGEVTSIVLDPSGSHDRAIYIATNDGGIWRSGDGGASWRPVSDSMPSLSMGAVTLDPSSPAIVYAGTGNGHDPGLTFSRGVGVYRSADGGETWSQLHADLFTGATIERLAVPSANGLLVGTSRGLYRSVDGGANFGSDPPSFRNGQPVVRASTVDLSLDTANPSTVYASFFGLGLLRSTDGGATFSTTLLPSREGVIFAQSTQPDQRTIYASAGDTPQSYRLLRSTDGGATFQTMPAAENRARNGPAFDDGGCSCVLNRTIGVDPQDSGRVYIGFRELYRSDDGGASFTNVSHGKVHVDHHALVFSPRGHRDAAPTRLYVGTDGGIATSADGGQTFVNLNEGIATSLFYGVDFGRGSADNNRRVYGGAQDNGVDVRRPTGPGLEWTTARPGDGGPPAADPNNPNRAYSSLVGGSPAAILVTSDGGESWATPGGVADVGDAGVDSTPPSSQGRAPVHSFPRIAVDASSGSAGRTSSVVYIADGARLLQTIDANADIAGQIRFAQIEVFANPITTMAIHDQVVWVGLIDGSVWRTGGARAGAAATWTPVAIAGRPSLPVGALAIDGGNVDRVAVGFFAAGVGPSNPAQHLFLTTDGGASWRDVSAGLPDLTINAVVLDAGPGSNRPHTVVAANTAGVLRSLDDGSTWAPLGAGLPAVDVTSLAFDPATSALVAGTYGRGAYELVLSGRPAGQAPVQGASSSANGRGVLLTAAAAVAGGLALALLVRRRRRAPRPASGPG
jgi:photosystem II stability/assembly factor-like uncharacterized protein